MSHLSSVAIPIIVWNCWVAFVALLGNSALFVTIVRAKNLRTISGNLLAVLSTCEVLTSILYYYYVYTLLMTTFYTRTECFWYTLPSQIVFQVTLSIVMVIAVDRYLSFRCRLWYKRVVTFRYIANFLYACLICGAATVFIMWTSTNDETVVCHMMNVPSGLAKKFVNTIHLLNVLLAFVLYIFLRFEVNQNEGLQSVENQLPVTRCFQKLIVTYVFCYGVAAILVFAIAGICKYSFVPDTLAALMDCLRIFSSATPFFIMYRGSEVYNAELRKTVEQVAPWLLPSEKAEEEKLNPNNGNKYSYSAIAHV